MPLFRRHALQTHLANQSIVIAIQTPQTPSPIAVAWGYDKDIVAGMSATTFAPDGLITREQMAVLLYGYTEKYAPAYLGGAASLNGFPDAASVSNWAYAAMSWAVGNGLISGIASNGADYLAPSGGATRAQIAAIMMRYCRLTGL